MNQVKVVLNQAGSQSLRITLLFGGPSRERDVSLASARKVAMALRARGHQVTAVDLSNGPLTASDERRVWGTAGVSEVIPDHDPKVGSEFDVLNGLNPSDIDLVFLALHGSPGEDGRVQAALDLKRIPYTGSSFSACSRTFDKHSAKLRFQAAGIDTPGWKLVRRSDAPDDRQDIVFPAVVKPRSEGSTVGISLVHSLPELEAAIMHARKFCDDVLVESYIEGRELTVGVFDGQALAIGEILLPPMSLFDYVRKYQSGRVIEKFPADLSLEFSAEIRRVALASHEALELGSYSRVDIRVDADHRPWVLEVNSLPGLTETSLLPQSASAAGLSYEDLCHAIAVGALPC